MMLAQEGGRTPHLGIIYRRVNLVGGVGERDGDQDGGVANGSGAAEIWLWVRVWICM